MVSILKFMTYIQVVDLVEIAIEDMVEVVGEDIEVEAAEIYIEIITSGVVMEIAIQEMNEIMAEVQETIPGIIDIEFDEILQRLIYDTKNIQTNFKTIIANETNHLCFL